MKPNARIRCPPSSSEDESNDSLLFECEDHWAKTQGQVAREGDWEMTNKISAFPVVYKWSRRAGTWVSWDPVPYQELKELSKAAKERGRGSHYFKNLLEAVFTLHMLISHDIKNTMQCVLSPAEYMLWERQWKRQLSTLVSIYETDPNKHNLVFEQIAGKDDFQKPNDQKRHPRSCTL